MACNAAEKGRRGGRIVERCRTLSVHKHTLEELLLQLSLGDLDLDGLVDLLLVAALVVGVVLDGGREQSVDEGSLSQARLTSNLSIGKTWRVSMP